MKKRMHTPTLSSRKRLEWALRRLESLIIYIKRPMFAYTKRPQILDTLKKKDEEEDEESKEKKEASKAAIVMAKRGASMRKVNTSAHPTSIFCNYFLFHSGGGKRGLRRGPRRGRHNGGATEGDCTPQPCTARV